MKIFKQNDYNNFLSLINLSSKQIEDIIRKYKLNFIQNRDDKIEWKVSFPIFLISFYDYILKNKTIPNQDEYTNYYIQYNKQWFSNRLDLKNNIGLKARLYRTYPSLVRDIHFSKYISEQLKDCVIIYNQDLDVKEGIDILLIYKNINYAINLYTDTSRAYEGRNKKKKRHINFNNIVYLEVPVNFNDSIKCGYFYLYGDKQLNKIKEYIKYI